MVFHNRKKRKSVVRRIALFAVLSEALVGVFQIFRRSRGGRKVEEAARNEIREVRELFRGEESFKQFCHDSRQVLRDFFIPHHGNDHRPNALRPKSLVVYLIAAVLVKVVASGALFLYYPSQARLARIVGNEIVDLANQARRAVGLPTLRVDPVLTASAQAKGLDMMARDYFAHDGPDGRKPWSWIDRQQYDYVYAGENLAVDFVAADAIHDAFMKSPSHRANIMNGHYEDIGVAVVSGQLGGHETELLVEFFGARRGSTAPLAENEQRPARAIPAPTLLATAPVLGVSPAVEPSVVPAAPALREPPVVAGVDAGTAVGGLPPSANEPPADAVSAALPNEPILVLGSESGTNNIVDFMLSFSNFFLIALVVFLAIALLLNIFIRVRVQHPDLILQSIAVLAILAAMLLTRLHFLERIGHELRIL